MDLLILAAGIGSRFGGLKQLTPIDELGRFIIDYSIEDAIKIGFDRIIFVIKKEYENDFQESIVKRIGNKIKTAFVYQNFDNLDINPKREKPLGTGHALLLAKDIISSKFVLINADDYYGYDALKLAYDSLKNDEYVNVAFEVKNTISLNGDVKRGLIYKDENDYLKEIDESLIHVDKNKITATFLDSNQLINIADNSLVSMNLMGLSNKIFPLIEKEFSLFLKQYKDSLTKEFLLPNLINEFVKKEKIKVKILKTTSSWVGMTYQSDLPNVKKRLMGG